MRSSADSTVVARPAVRVLHPLVAYLERHLAALSALVILECDGAPVEFDGFRLRDLAAWADLPYHSLLDNLGALSGYCNARCDFCYEFGNPLPYDRTMLGLAEARTRARYFDPTSQRGLLQFSERLDMEPFSNPWLFEILSLFRQHNATQVISLTTNGSWLTEANLERLAAVAPVHLVVSLNSCDAPTRARTMHDPHPAVAIGAVAALRRHGIPFTGSIVAWPGLSGDELRATIRFLDGHSARAIRVSLPSYSGYFGPGQEQLDTSGEWDRIVAVVEEEAEWVSTPVCAVPYLYAGEPITARVTGVMRASPAALAGVRRGDIIASVAGQPVMSRMGCKAQLNAAILASGGAVEIEVLRGGAHLPMLLDDRIDPDEDRYPYKPAGYPSPSTLGESGGSLLGLVLNDDLDPSDLWRVVALCQARQAQTAVLMTSALLEPVVSAYFEQHPALVAALADRELIIVSPQHQFWGGNIVVGDLYTCSDYIACLRRIIVRLRRRPDLVIIPATFSSNHWTDVAGVPYSMIELETGVPVELLPCKRIVV